MTSSGDLLAVTPVAEIDVLGPLKIRKDGYRIPITLTQGRVLGILAAAGGHLVGKHALQRRLSGREPTKQTDQVTRRHIADLRAALGKALPRSVPGSAIIASGTLGGQPGYRVNVAITRIDAHDFERHVVEGSSALHDGRWQAAIASLAAADQMWRGDPLADVAGPDLLGGWKDRLASSRQAAICGYAEAMIRVGRHREAISPLITHTHAHPGNGMLWQLLAVALYSDHRDGDASGTLRHANAAFDREGLDPACFQRLHQRILRLTLPRDGGQALDLLGFSRRPAPPDAALGPLPAVFTGSSRRPHRLLRASDQHRS